MAYLHIDTAHLTLFPLPQDRLYLYLTDPNAVEQKLGYPISRNIITDTVHRAILNKIQKIASLPVSQYSWVTYWLIKIKDPAFGAGLIGFKGIPNEKGIVEIGYGIDPAVRGRGLMTEAVRAFTQWALLDESCQGIIAKTKPTNIASQKVLQKVGYQRDGEEENFLRWRIEKF